MRDLMLPDAKQTIRFSPGKDLKVLKVDHNVGGEPVIRYQQERIASALMDFETDNSLRGIRNRSQWGTTVHYRTDFLHLVTGGNNL